MIEFTGERVIPGQVEDELWNEHLARYLLAQRFAGNGWAVDLGCGTGYGTALLAQRGRALGMDVSLEAIAHARRSYPDIHFLQADAARVPLANGSASLVTAFEIVEHLENWPALLDEARRILSPQGILLISTPNRDTYTESRGAAGANPFHAHEFNFSEFRQVLEARFPKVQILLQNRTECFSFHVYRQPWKAAVQLDGGGGEPESSHFFLGVCTVEADLPQQAFVYVPRASNLLREREMHIRRLQQELAQKDGWLATLREEHAALVKLHGEQLQQLEEHNRWAMELESQLKATQSRLSALQDEFTETTKLYESKIAELDEENIRKTAWAREIETRLTGELNAKCQELQEALRILQETEATLEERTSWALKLQEELNQATALVRGAQASRWVKLGRAIGLGPDLPSHRISGRDVP